jgi:hypothetical protein
MVRYRWAVLELLDQLVREQSGGLMGQAVALKDFDLEFAITRFRDVFDEFSPSRPEHRRDPGPPLLARLAALTPRSLVAGIHRRVKDAGRRLCGTRALLSEPRSTGELNKWMYDELSLETLLAAGGFDGYRRQDHRSSMIPNWSRYALDESTRGTHAIEPSLYVEARKPA